MNTRPSGSASCYSQLSRAAAVLLLLLAWTPLHCAALIGHTNVAGLLLASKAEVNARDKEGATPLHIAEALDHKDIVDLLLANNAEVNATNSQGAMPTNTLVALGHQEVVEVPPAHAGEADAQGVGPGG